MEDNWVHVKRTVTIPVSDTAVKIRVCIDESDTLEHAFDEGLYYGIRATIECMTSWMNTHYPIIINK